MANCAQKLCMYTKIYHHGPEAILSDEQLAMILGVDSSLIRSWAKKGGLRVKSYGYGELYFKWGEIVSFVSKNI